MSDAEDAPLTATGEGLTKLSAFAAQSPTALWGGLGISVGSDGRRRRRRREEGCVNTRGWRNVCIFVKSPKLRLSTSISPSRIRHKSHPPLHNSLIQYMTRAFIILFTKNNSNKKYIRIIKDIWRIRLIHSDEVNTDTNEKNVTISAIVNIACSSIFTTLRFVE